MKSLPVKVEGEAGVVVLLKSIVLINQLIDAPISVCLEGANPWANNPEAHTSDKLRGKSLIQIV
jgi:hypothetical protein